MYTKNSTIYADAGKYLVDGCTIGFTLPSGEHENVIEKNVDFSDMKVRKMFNDKIAVCSNDCISFMFKDNSTFESIVKSIIEKRYNQDEQISIITQKELSSDTERDFQRLQEWIDFSEHAAKEIMRTIGQEINETLDGVKRNKLIEVNKYDSSTAINSFKYGEYEIWLDKATRVGLMNSTAILQNAGETNTTLWLGNIHVTLPCERVILMLSQIEMYALECYNVTAQHKAVIESLSDIDAIKTYDYKAGYPERLVFEVA